MKSGVLLFCLSLFSSILLGPVFGCIPYPLFFIRSYPEYQTLRTLDPRLGPSKDLIIELPLVTYDSFTQAIIIAKEEFKTSLSKNVIIMLGEGYHKIDFPNTNATIDLTDIKPAENRRLIIKGKGCELTTLEVPLENKLFHGQNIDRLTIRDFKITRSRQVERTRHRVDF